MSALGKYELLKKVATGGMAEVWLARQSGPDGFQRSLVVKRILPHLASDPQFVRMLLNEAKIAARLNHPNIAQIYDLGSVAGEPFIAMEFVRGRNLGRVIRKAWSKGYWIAQALAIRIAAACCEALSYAHGMRDDEGTPLRIVHRDISPQNILISFDGSVKLVDFGIAKAADVACPTMSGQLKGKFAYMSPEQAMGKDLDRRSDLYALGLVLYELLTGVRPLQREGELATLAAAKECELSPPSHMAEEIPPELDAIVMKALARRPEDRYQDAREFQMALEEYLVEQRWVATSLQLAELMDALFSDHPKGAPKPIPEITEPVKAFSVEAKALADPDITCILQTPESLQAVRLDDDDDSERMPTNVFPTTGQALFNPLRRREKRFQPRRPSGARRWDTRRERPGRKTAQERRVAEAEPVMAEKLQVFGAEAWVALRAAFMAAREWTLARLATLREARALKAAR